MLKGEEGFNKLNFSTIFLDVVGNLTSLRDLYLTIGSCFRMLSVHISSYGCTREVWRAREKRKSC